MQNRKQAKLIQFAFERKLVFFFSLAFIALLSILIVFYRHAQKVKSSRQLLENTHQLLNKIYAVQIGIENIETNARGFYLTGNNTFLEPLSKSISLLNTNLEQLTALSRNDNERLKIDSLKSLISKKVVYINNNLEIRKEKGLDEIGKVVASGVGQSYSIDIKNRVDKLDNELHSQIDKCNLEDENNMQVTKLMFGVLLLFIIVILIAVGFIIVRNQNSRDKFEEELRKSKELFSKLFNGNPAAMAISRLDDGKILNVNNSMVEILGFKDKNELIGKSTKELFILAQPELREEAAVKLQNDEIVKNVEMVVRKTNGDRILFSTTAAYIEIDSVPCLFAVALDITEQKKAEEERTKIIDDLAQRNSELEQFSYMISHNLRAPVANILGIVDIMQTVGIDSGEEEKVTTYLDIASKNLDMVIKDINHILEVKNNISEKTEPVKFDHLLLDVKLGIACMLKDKEIRITGDFSGAEEIVTIKSYIYSIFYNLISNSIKYRQNGVQTIIEISSVKIKNKLLLKFKDNGLGFDLKKSGGEVFGLYKRFHYHVEGKGMGLFMVKTQVQSLGGKISLASEVNNGSEFTIEFEIDT